MARILIIEDDTTIAHVLRVLLQTQGHEVLAASNGARGVMSAQRRADVIVLDLMMPVMDGFAVLEELNQDERTAAIPVIVVTAMHTAAVEPGVPSSARGAASTSRSIPRRSSGSSRN